MTFKELKKQTLFLLFPGERDFEMTEIARLSGEEPFAAVLSALPGALNRCFGDLYHRGALPESAVRLSGGTVRGEQRVFSLPLPADSAVTGLFDGSGNPIPFRLFGQELFAPADAAAPMLTFRAPLPVFSALTPEETELPVPDAIGALVPYFLKGELCRDTDPEQAGEARNFYEQALEVRGMPCPGNSYVSRYFTLSEV